jgi:small conductance mechanosensitive channel
VNGADYWTVYWDLTRQMKEAFDEAGISIPYPQTDLHVKHLPQEAPRAGGVSAPSAPGPRDATAAHARGDAGADAPEAAADDR